MQTNDVKVKAIFLKSVHKMLWKTFILAPLVTIIPAPSIWSSWPYDK